MKVGVDVRSLTSPTGRGVSHYALAVLAAMAEQFPGDRFELLQTGRRPFALPPQLRRRNVGLTHYRHSNKLLNLRLSLTDRPRLDAWLPPIDIFFAPNLGFVNISPDRPLVVTVHDLSFERFPDQYSRRERAWHRAIRPRRLLERANRIIAVSQQTADELTDRYSLDPARLRVVPSGIDAAYRVSSDRRRTEAARIRRKYQLPETYFLFVGAHDPRKRLKILLQGFVRAKRQGLRAALVLAGSVSPDLVRLVRQTGEPAVHLLGYVPEADKPGLYAGALAVTLLSVHEGFGFPPLEAAAVGVPSLVSDLPVFAETLGKARLAIPVDDIAGTCEKLVHLERHPAARRRVGAAAKRASRRLTWPRTARTTMNILRDTQHA